MTIAFADALVRATANPGFRYVVAVGGVPLGAFTECTLPVLEWEVQEVQEGGQNTYVHSLLGRRKKATLTLKNGVGLASQMLGWYSRAMSELMAPAGLRTVTVTLYNSMNVPVMVWHMDDCVPVKWTGPTLKSDENTIAIQTLELACGLVTWEMT